MSDQLDMLFQGEKPDPDILKQLQGAGMVSRLWSTIAGGGRRAAIIRKVLDRCLWVDRGSPYGPCLEWQGGDSGKPGRGRAKGRGHSYPRMTLDGLTAAVHRVVWITLNGFLPAKKQLDHLCSNRRCVLHTEPVTHKENQRRRDRNANAKRPEILPGHLQCEAVR